MSDITAANAVIMLTIPLLYPVPQRLEGFSAENIFENDEVEIAENKIGVDGKKSSGFVPYMTPWTIHFQADSPSVTIFENWAQASKAAQQTLPAGGLVSLSSIGRAYTMLDGTLTRLKQMADAAKVLQPRRFTIVWGDISPAPV